MILLAFLGLGAVRAAAADVTIDAFSNGEIIMTLNAVGDDTSTTSGLNSVIGGTRSIYLEMTAAGPVPEVKAQVVAMSGLLNYTASGDDDGHVALT